MGFALCFGFWLTWIYYAYPNLVLAVLTHAWLGTLLQRVTGLYTRIGPFYLNPERYIFREVFPFVRTLVGDLF
jgi:hypothetical protein